MRTSFTSSPRRLQEDDASATIHRDRQLQPATSTVGPGLSTSHGQLARGSAAMPSSSNGPRRQKVDLLQDHASTLNGATKPTGGSSAAFSSSKAGRVLSAEATSAAAPRGVGAPTSGTTSDRAILTDKGGTAADRSTVEAHGQGDAARLREMLNTIGDQDGSTSARSAQRYRPSKSGF